PYETFRRRATRRQVTPAYQNTCLPKLCVGKLELWQALWRAGTKPRLACLPNESYRMNRSAGKSG
ncbi:MAG: hypothetical protein KKH32_07440, partial [Bacteroidetes bacterium]|nr:hypothetical protein [Bacteroidota bacterium]